MRQMCDVGVGLGGRGDSEGLGPQPGPAPNLKDFKPQSGKIEVTPNPEARGYVP